VSSFLDNFLSKTPPLLSNVDKGVKLKGTTLLDCMRQNLKDQWVTANKVRTYCARAGGYTREVLDEAAKMGLIERKEEVKPKIYYKIDPPLGHSNPICPFEPYVTYDESVCVSLEKIIEDCVESRYHGGRSESCDFLDYFAREKFSQLTYTPLTRDSEFRNDFLRDLEESFPYREGGYNMKASIVV
jgi:hypothetical protein